MPIPNYKTYQNQENHEGISAKVHGPKKLLLLMTPLKIQHDLMMVTSCLERYEYLPVKMRSTKSMKASHARTGREYGLSTGTPKMEGRILESRTQRSSLCENGGLQLRQAGLKGYKSKAKTKKKQGGSPACVKSTQCAHE